MKNKSFLTTMAGIVSAVVLLSLTFALIFDKIDKDDYQIAMGVLTPLALGIIGYLAKDANKTGV